MRHLGIDYGSKRVGIAVSSEGIAFPRGVVANDDNLLAAVRDIAKKEKVSSIVVGDARSFGGMENPVTKDAEAFVARLRKETELPVATIWEAGSSVESSRYIGEKRDESAAAVILQRFLDARKRA